MFFCPGNELFYAMLYLSYFTTGPLYMFYILAVICFPVAVLKTGIACLQVSVLIIQLRDTVYSSSAVLFSSFILETES